MKVLVTGGSGFVGREVVRQLHAAGHAVRILARHRPQEGSATEVCLGDVTNAASLANATQGMDAVIHLVGIISELGTATFENVHTRGTENILSAARQSGVKRFVHMSALGTRPNAASRYHQTKWAAEEAVRASGLDWTIFRPSVIYGPGDGFVNLFVRISRFSPVLPVMGSGRSKLQPVPVSDVATCFTRAITEPRAIGQAYDLCGRDRLTLIEVLDTILEVTGRSRLKLRIPMALAKAQAAIMECMFRGLLGTAPPVNRDQLLMLAEDNVGDPKPAKEVFGVEMAGFKEGLARCLTGSSSVTPTGIT
jgi:NADH dehydrogenase